MTYPSLLYSARRPRDMLHQRGVRSAIFAAECRICGRRIPAEQRTLLDARLRARRQRAKYQVKDFNQSRLNQSAHRRSETNT